MADRLSRMGYAVLRFDYRGTGDSYGDDQDVCLRDWTDDVLLAHQELRFRSGVDDCIWLGMRLGATLAVQAASSAPIGLRRMVLWEPVFDGKQYLADLRASHIANLAVALGVHAQGDPRKRIADLTAFQDEACGFALPGNFRAELSQLSPSSLPCANPQISLAVLSDPKTSIWQAAASWSACQDQSVKQIATEHGIVWTSETMDEGNLVPGQTIVALAKAVEWM
ncbi:MAG: alpha/beta hydrolase [Burkholderiales bacterium]|nr:alpha/beta hydrolase [Burkholderiales bacterium]